ncbi:MAG: hypothetical protein ACI4VX_04730 [Succinivibrionaceae bacterium]
MTECMFYHLKNPSWEQICSQLALCTAQLFRNWYPTQGQVLVLSEGRLATDISSAIWKTPGFVPCEKVITPKDCSAPVIVSQEFSPEYNVLVNLKPFREAFNETELKSPVIVDFSFGQSLLDKDNASLQEALEKSRCRYRQLKSHFPELKFISLD